MATTGTFSINANEINRSGAKFQEFSNNYKSLMTSLRSTIEDLGICWKSEDYTQFLAIYQQNAESIEQMSKAFASFGNILSTTSSSITKASEELKSSFK